MPFRRLIAFALSELGWSEDDFWAATPFALYAALDLRSGAFKREDFAAFKREVEGGDKSR